MLTLLVGVAGLEPTASASQMPPSTKLAYTPINWRLQGRYKITNRQNYHALNVPLVDDMGIEPICFPVCKTGDHPMQSHRPLISILKT